MFFRTKSQQAPRYVHEILAAKEISTHLVDSVYLKEHEIQFLSRETFMINKFSRPQKKQGLDEA